MLPDGNIINSTHTGLCPGLDELPEAARIAHVFPKLTSGALMSVPQLCDHDCTVTFKKRHARVYYNNRLIMTAKRCYNSRLWCVEPEESTPQETSDNAINSVIILPNKERTRFLHGALFSPPTSTLRVALNEGWLKTWPHMDMQHLQKEAESTVLGRLDTIRKSKTKVNSKISKEEMNIKQEPKTNLFIAKVMNLDETTCSDQTGKFPCISSKGNRYIMTIYCYDANAILLRPIKNRTGNELSKTLEDAFDYLTERGCKPKFHIMDNEAAKNTITMIQRKKINLQLAPPDLHRRSPAERAIRTAKNHILSGIASTHKDFPTHLWCRIIDQGEMTLNMLRPCRTNPRMSACTALEGEFNYERTPLAPPGMKGIIHKKQ